MSSPSARLLCLHSKNHHSHPHRLQHRIRHHMHFRLSRLILLCLGVVALLGVVNAGSSGLTNTVPTAPSCSPGTYADEEGSGACTVAPTGSFSPLSVYLVSELSCCMIGRHRRIYFPANFSDYMLIINISWCREMPATIKYVNMC
jgi:hypothetical protein